MFRISIVVPSGKFFKFTDDRITSQFKVLNNKSLMLWYRKTVYCLHTPDLCTQMPQLSFIRCTVCHYMIYTYNTDSLLSLISVLIAKTTDYIPCKKIF